MGNVNMEASQINYRGGSKKMSVEEAIKAAGTEITPEEKEWIDTIPELASQEIIAPEFDAEEGVYAVGDLVIYQGGLYQFTTAHETAGAWNAEEVAAVKVSDEIDSLKSGLTNVSTWKLIKTITNSDQTCTIPSNAIAVYCLCHINNVIYNEVDIFVPAVCLSGEKYFRRYEFDGSGGNKMIIGFNGLSITSIDGAFFDNGQWNTPGLLSADIYYI